MGGVLGAAAHEKRFLRAPMIVTGLTHPNHWPGPEPAPHPVPFGRNKSCHHAVA